MVIAKDKVTLIPVLRDPFPTPGAMTKITLASTGTQVMFTTVFDVGSYTEGLFFCNMISETGTNPTLDISIQYSIDGKLFVDSGDAFTQITTSVGLTFKKLTANFGRYMRLKITLGGTNPSYVVSVAGQFKN